MFECKEFYEEGRQLDRMQQDSRHNIRHEGGVVKELPRLVNLRILNTNAVQECTYA